MHERWHSPPESLELPPDEVHVWRVSIPAPDHHLAHGRNVLSDDERVRADQFKFDKHRDSYTTTRAALRELLAQYMDVTSASLRFDVNEYGKPALAAGCNRLNIQFNVSHSGAYALLAFGIKRGVGVDVERVRDDVHEIRDLLLSSREQQSFDRLAANQHLASLFHVWTSKEAIVKALGQGFSIPLKDVEVDVDPERPPSLLALSPQIGNARDWKLYGLIVDEQYSAAIAACAEVRRLRCWDWS